jgi:hypothetical protein
VYDCDARPCVASQQALADTHQQWLDDVTRRQVPFLFVI